ncbi:hypothetical protein K435DRAFT_800532 [Dendrothele bispora CBS 962.96]|uniref:Uncharacterized protein n=1 Tax=Dendrothele bispora (strain CBS 962.96) TaxID=1314807 RepID=A0A4S8LSG7_DENBC|nr:hypothetical protein K435DRAFT_800532 [Dendrothele bispora CBS 962.96]
MFDLVPPDFDHWASVYYQQIGSPVVTRHNVWNVYEAILLEFENNGHLLLDTFNLEGYHDDREDFVREVQQALQVEIHNIVDDLVPLAYDEEGGYMGGVCGGLGPEIEEVDAADGEVPFSDDDDGGE